MEKKWFCYFGLCALIILSSSVVGAAPEVKPVKVDIEVPIVGGDLAGARQSSQSLAFREALKQVLPSAMPEEEKEKKLSGATQYIKSHEPDGLAAGEIFLSYLTFAM